MLQLVIWRLSSGRWSLDALHMRQEVGQQAPSTAAERAVRLRDALTGG
jgi:hypothetical protein